ncbi:Universal stress protein family protein [Caldanaerobius fijiensis DSM 17918]|uniref:Universal stress protein family protein n=1 Tax=Caldanaerobius fijiensis DSM 17918 TaxID=1121256 RepID=A0A1M4VPC1_9THEO|nr:universal stress protein UspA [Caldanaerobius fijiensis]SHE70693.1 Universal stress protein family protein [Caldanaerobius fijiensis DSM 17918]
MIKNFDPGTRSRIMVCITPQRSCIRLIERGAQRANETKGEFCVVYVNKSEDISKDIREHKILLDLFDIAQKMGGTVTILTGKKIYETLAQFAKENNITEIIVGKSLRSAFEVIRYGDVINPLKKQIEKSNIFLEVVD